MISNILIPNCICLLFREALDEAGLSPENIDAIAYTKVK